MRKFAILLIHLIYLYAPLVYADDQSAQPSPYDSDNRGVTKDDESDGFPDEQETNLYSG